jgi:hypothetical protein
VDWSCMGVAVVMLMICAFIGYRFYKIQSSS